MHNMVLADWRPMCSWNVYYPHSYSISTGTNCMTRLWLKIHSKYLVALPGT